MGARDRVVKFGRPPVLNATCDASGGFSSFGILQAWWVAQFASRGDVTSWMISSTCLDLLYTMLSLLFGLQVGLSIEWFALQHEYLTFPFQPAEMISGSVTRVTGRSSDAVANFAMECTIFKNCTFHRLSSDGWFCLGRDHNYSGIGKPPPFRT